MNSATQWSNYFINCQTSALKSALRLSFRILLILLFVSKLSLKYSLSGSVLIHNFNSELSGWFSWTKNAIYLSTQLFLSRIANRLIANSSERKRKKNLFLANALKHEFCGELLSQVSSTKNCHFLFEFKLAKSKYWQICPSRKK